MKGHLGGLKHARPFPVIPALCTWWLSSKWHRCANGTCRGRRQSRLVAFGSRQHHNVAMCCQVLHICRQGYAYALTPCSQPRLGQPQSLQGAEWSR